MRVEGMHESAASQMREVIPGKLIHHSVPSTGRRGYHRALLIQPWSVGKCHFIQGVYLRKIEEFRTGIPRRTRGLEHRLARVVGAALPLVFEVQARANALTSLCAECAPDLHLEYFACAWLAGLAVALRQLVYVEDVGVELRVVRLVRDRVVDEHPLEQLRRLRAEEGVERVERGVAARDEVLVEVEDPALLPDRAAEIRRVTVIVEMTRSGGVVAMTAFMAGRAAMRSQAGLGMTSSVAVRGRTRWPAKRGETV
eukprot:gene3199-biopygen11671